MKFKKLAVILLVTISMVGMLGGCGMKKNSSVSKNESIEIQDKMAKHMIDNYIGVKEIVFLDYYIDNVTGYVSSEVFVNNRYKVTLSYSEGSDIVTADYYDNFDLEKKKIVNPDYDSVKITYYDQGDKNGD